MKKVLGMLIFLVLPLLLVAGGIGWNKWANAHVVATRYTVESSRLPEAFDGTCVLFVSDLHNAPFSAEIIAIAEAERPSLVLFGGDMVQLPEANIKQTLAIADAIAAALPETRMFAVSGNHDRQCYNYAGIMEELAAHGVEGLEDQCVTITRGEEQILLAGLADPAYDYIMQNQYERARQTLGRFFGGSDTFRLLVNHRADMYPEIKDAGADLILSGHLHGGLIRIPFKGGLIGHGGVFFPDYTYGRYAEGGAEMIVSGGCDANAEKFRVFNPPEVLLITLERKG